MKLVDILLIFGLAVLLGLIVLYILRAKKRGKKCIGCPEGSCPGASSGNCGCCQGCGAAEAGQTR